MRYKIHGCGVFSFFPNQLTSHDVIIKVTSQLGARMKTELLLKFCRMWKDEDPCLAFSLQPLEGYFRNAHIKRYR
jgi:hypothetical protein